MFALMCHDSIETQQAYSVIYLKGHLLIGVAKHVVTGYAEMRDELQFISAQY